ncbi:MAG: MBL fold metallo-hydrolase [Bacteroidia bacterium]
MKVMFLGTGGAHDTSWGNSAALIFWQNKTFLVDCGFTVYPKLVENHLVEHIDAVVITHLHDDHIGSLSALLYHRHFISKKPPTPVLLGHEKLTQALKNILSIMMGHLEPFAQFLPSESWGIQALDTTGLHMAHMPSCAYVWENESTILVYSGDIGRPLAILDTWRENPPAKKRVVLHDMAFHQTATHCHYKALIPYRDIAEIRGYHHNPLQVPPDNPFPLVGPWVPLAI